MSSRQCSAIVIQHDLESWVYDCPQLRGGGEETDVGREREKERAAFPLTFSPIIPSQNISRYCIAQVYSSLLSLFSSPAGHK